MAAKRGRPCLPDAVRRRKMANTRLRAVTHQRLEALAIAQGRSLSGQIEEIIEAVLARAGATPPADAPGAKRGRPPNSEGRRIRVALGLRVTTTMKSMLDEAAMASGRSQSQEAEMRLEQSFDREATVAATLAALRGRGS